MTEKNFAAMFEQARRTKAYWAERAKLDFIESLHCMMERHGINRAELARRLDSSPAYVTKALRGDANLTLETMARLARAVGGEFRCRVVEDGARLMEIAHGRQRRTVWAAPSQFRAVEKRAGQVDARDPIAA